MSPRDSLLEAGDTAATSRLRQTADFADGRLGRRGPLSSGGLRMRGSRKALPFRLSTSVRRQSRIHVPAALDRAFRRRRCATLYWSGARPKPVSWEFRSSGDAGAPPRYRRAGCIRLPFDRRPAAARRSGGHRLAAAGDTGVDRRSRRTRHARRGGDLARFRQPRTCRPRWIWAADAGRGQAASPAHHRTCVPRHHGAGERPERQLRAHQGEGRRSRLCQSIRLVDDDDARLGGGARDRLLAAGFAGGHGGRRCRRHARLSRDGCRDPRGPAVYRPHRASAQVRLRRSRRRATQAGYRL